MYIRRTSYDKFGTKPSFVMYKTRPSDLKYGIWLSLLCMPQDEAFVSRDQGDAFLSMTQSLSLLSTAPSQELISMLQGHSHKLNPL